MARALTLEQIAAQLGGRIVGDAGVLIRQVASLAAAGEGEIAFFSDSRYRRQLAATRASAVVVGPDAESLTKRPRIVADNPYAYFARVSLLFNPRTVQPVGVHPAASVAPGVRLGARVSIGAGCVVGEGVEIGDDACLYPGVVVYPGCRIGARTIVHSATVIGADGFGFAEDHGRWVKIPQIGRVVIGEEVEIGAACSIDRGALEDTVIEDGVKLDNQIQIGHGCRIGAHTAMAGCAGVAGSTRIGRHCAIGASAVILGHLEICDHVRVSACTVITRSIRRPGTYTGVYPFDAHASWTRNAALLRHLAALGRRVRELERKLEAKESGDG